MSNALIDMVAMLARWGADMDDGFAAFDVEGLVIVGQTFSGTPGSVVGRINGVPQFANAVLLIRIAALRGTNPDGAGESWTDN